MKVWKKLQVVFLALLLCTGMMTQPALAASLLRAQSNYGNRGWRETDSDMHKARIMGSGQQN